MNVSDTSEIQNGIRHTCLRNKTETSGQPRQDILQSCLVTGCMGTIQLLKHWSPVPFEIPSDIQDICMKVASFDARSPGNLCPPATAAEGHLGYATAL